MQRIHRRAMRHFLTPIMAGCLLAVPSLTEAQPRLKVLGGTWVAQGPGPSTGGQVENIVPDDEVVGGIHTAAAHPTNADILYAGAVNGGIWKTTDATAASPDWVHQTDPQAALSIGALEFDPTDAGNETLVAGIGRYSSFGRLGGDRVGLLRTTDGGATWTSTGSDLDGLNISGVAPRGATIVVSVNTGIDTGIFRSTDTGATFTRVSTGDGSATGLPGGFSYDMAGDRGDPGRLFTTILDADSEGGVNGVYRTTDTGASWTKVSDAAVDALLSDTQTSNVEIAVGPSDSVYVAIANNGRLAGVFRSGNGGGTWTAMDLPSDGAFGIHPGGQAGIHFSIVADPNNADRVYIGGDRQDFPNNVGAFDFSGRLFRGNASALPGSQWAHLTHSDSLGPAGGGTASTSAPHADSREMVVDANGELIETDDGGIYRRTSPQDNTGDWFSINGNIQTTELHDAAYDANADIVTGGAQDTGSPAQLVPDMATWFSVSTADGGDVAIDDVTTPGFSTRYSSFQFLGAFRRQVYNADNVLQSTTSPSLTVIGGGAPLSTQFVTPVTLNTIAPTRMIIGGSNSVYESLDQGDTLSEIGPGIPVNGSGREPIAYGAAGNEDILYIGSGSSVFVRTSAAPAPLVQSGIYPATGTVSDIAIDPDNPSAAYVVDSGLVYQTLDAGATWTDITGNLPSLDPGSVRSVTYIDRPNGDGVAVGTFHGVYAALEMDGFAIWDSLGSGFPTVPVFELDYDAGDDVLVAGTLGRGSWKLTPTLPNDLIFTDGFESGDTSAWTATVP